MSATSATARPGVTLNTDDWGLIGEPSFIGMRNYLRLWQDPLFWRALANTLLYATGTVPTAMAIGLLLALSLDRRLPAQALFRGLYCLPLVVSAVALILTTLWVRVGFCMVV